MPLCYVPVCDLVKTDVYSQSTQEREKVHRLANKLNSRIRTFETLELVLTGQLALLIQRDPAFDKMRH